jgi:uncharacterized paraquat-inducible protein A
MTHEVPSQPQPGMPCPECGCFIKMPIIQLLSAAGFTCGDCGLQLSIDRSKSQKAMRLLQDLHIAQQNAQAAKKQ